MSMMRLEELAELLDGALLGGDALFDGVSIDTRGLEPGDLFVALQGPRYDGHDFVVAAWRQGARAALVSRPVKAALPQVRVADTRLALGRLGAAWRARFRGPLIALTGSNGKTTVKEMLAAILGNNGKVLATRGNLNNDIGVPLTLLRLGGDHDFAVIEMGANHGGEIAYLTGLTRPDVALVNNAGPAHLEGFGDLDGVARAKGEIFQGLGNNGIAVINRDDPYADYWSGLVKGRQVVDFGLDRAAQIQGRVLDASCNLFELRVPGRQMDIQLPLAGTHNLRNALAAAAASVAVGIEIDAIGRGLENMQGVKGRLQRLSGPNGSTLIDDTYNANPASLAAALDALSVQPGPHWLVLGDMAELGSDAVALHEQAGQRARTAGCRRLFGFGENSRRAVRAFGPGAAHFDTIEALVAALRQAIKEECPTLLIKGSRSMRLERIVQALGATPFPAAKQEIQS
jgi:UDP-N-acetylmuramoyl-tripeptide--D-alanyl-D-alanine ligase